MKTVDVFIKSYQKDFIWLSYSLKSFKKYVTGYNNLIILIPENEKTLFDTRELPERTEIHYVKEYGVGYLFQQWCKISAHRFSSADYIMFSDSDLIYDHAICLTDFIADDKPEILYTDYSKVGNAICWKEVTEAFIKEPMQYEMMRRNNLIYHTDTLRAIEKYEPNLEYIIMNSVRFSEFNAMSAYAWFHEREKYNFVNTDNWEYTRPKAVQYFSHGEFDKMRLEHSEL